MGQSNLGCPMFFFPNAKLPFEGPRGAQGGRSTPNLLTTVSDCRMSKTSVQPVDIKGAFASWERPLQELRMWKMMLRRNSPLRAQC